VLLLVPLLKKVPLPVMLKEMPLVMTCDHDGSLIKIQELSLKERENIMNFGITSI